MLVLSHRPVDRPSRRLHRLAVVVACAALGLAVGMAARAETPNGRRPGEPLTSPMPISASDAATIRGRAGAVVRNLGIPGRPSAPRRTRLALDLRVVDESEVVDGHGRTRAVIRMDGETGDLRSVVRLDWTSDANRPRVDRSAAADHARRQAGLAGLVAPGDAPSVGWDEAMDAWRVSWARRIDGYQAAGDGLTVWVYRGGQLAALKRSETPHAATPIARVSAAAAVEAARAWAVRQGRSAGDLSTAAADELVWVRPNDFLVRGGADDTDVRLHLAYRIDLTVPTHGGEVHHIAIFVDAGSGALIAGVETA
jgi:hypothetical protein